MAWSRGCLAVYVCFRSIPLSSWPLLWLGLRLLPLLAVRLLPASTRGMSQRCNHPHSSPPHKHINSHHLQPFLDPIDLAEISNASYSNTTTRTTFQPLYPGKHRSRRSLRKVREPPYRLLASSQKAWRLGAFRSQLGHKPDAYSGLHQKHHHHISAL